MTPPADLATEPRLLDAVELLADAVSQLARDSDGQGREGKSQSCMRRRRWTCVGRFGPRSGRADRLAKNSQETGIFNIEKLARIVFLQYRLQGQPNRCSGSVRLMVGPLLREQVFAEPTFGSRTVTTATHSDHTGPVRQPHSPTGQPAHSLPIRQAAHALRSQASAQLEPSSWTRAPWSV